MRVKPSERRWILGFAVLVMLASTVPYFLGYQNQGKDWRYSGVLFATEDQNSYLAKMLEGTTGAWLFTTPYTAYPQKGVLAFLPFLLLGKLAAGTDEHIQLVVLYQLFRLAGGVLLILAAYDFASLFIQGVKYRRLAAALVVLGGGLGWLFPLGLTRLWSNGIPGLELPLEFYSPETFGFLMIFGLPHLAFARAFLLWGTVAYLSPVEQGRSPAIMGGLLWLGIGLMQPLTIVVGWVILLVHLAGSAVWNLLLKRSSFALFPWSAWRTFLWRAFWMVLISSPFVLYTFTAFQLDPFLKGWQAQNIILSPPFLHYLLAYALLLPFALFSIPWVIRTYGFKGLLLAGWLIAFPFLAYAPYNLQRRLPEGIWVVICVLAIMWIEKSSARIQRWSLVPVSLAFLSTLFLYAGGVTSVTSPQPPLFLPNSEVKAFTFIAEQVPKSSVMLAANETSNPLPAWAPVRTLLGHGPESLNITSIEPRVKCFYQPQCSDADRLELISEFHITYVFWGPAERNLGTWVPQQAAFLNPVYGQDGVVVFKVTPVFVDHKGK